MDVNSVLAKDFVRDLIVQTCGFDIEILKRNDCFVVRSKNEDETEVDRIILLPPKGFTANALNQMNSHDEAEFATIQVKGAVKDNKSGFSKLKNCLLVAAKSENGSFSDLNQPYLTYDLKDKDNNLTLDFHSSGTSPFYVVKVDGYGFYHNLINVTEEWLVLKLKKKIRPQKKIVLENIFSDLLEEQKIILEKLYNAVVKYGDNLYRKEPALIADVLKMDISKSTSSLAQMLYIHDSGMHEACTIFSLILKIGNAYPEEVKTILTQLAKENKMPSYYSRQLINKIEKRQERLAA